VEGNAIRTSLGIGIAIAELEPPSTVKEVWQYLGVASWFRRFVPDNLNDLLRKGSKWEWTPEHQTAFEEVKAKLAADPVLAARTSVELSPCKQTPATTQAIDYVSNTDRHRKWRKSNLLFEPNT